MEKSKLTCISMNVDTLTNKLSELKFLINDINPDIIAVNEVLPKNIKNPIHKEEFSMEGYEMITHPNVALNKGRGSITYIKNNIINKEIKLGPKFDDFEESIFTEIKLNKSDKLLCANIYRRGESNDENNKKLLKILKELKEKNYAYLAIMGDFNLKDINWEDQSCPGNDLNDFNHKFIKCVQDCFLFQHITEPTRKRGQDTPSVLDLVFSNEENMIKDVEYLAPLGRSDHSIIKFSIPCKLEITIPKIKIQYEKGNYKGLNEKLNTIEWDKEFEKYPSDVNRQWEFFKNKFTEAEKEFVPRKTVYVNGRKNKNLSNPLDRKTLRKIKKKNKIWSKMRKNLASVEQELQYNRLRNQIRKLTRKGKKLIEKTIAKNSKANPKAFWRYTQSKLKTKATIPDLVKPGTEENPEYTKNDSEKAEAFSSYFSSVFTQELDSEEMPYFEKRNYEEALENIIITKDMILTKLKKLKTNKSPGPDKIHPRVLHDVADSLSTPLEIIFKTSLSCKEIPEDWKQANVSSIFKKGKKTLPQNYRPVSLTCIVCKMLEGIIRDSIVKHMKKNNLFSSKQFGFIAGRSTILQLLHVMNIWTEIMDQGGCLDVVYCDFMKAFDKVPHKRLLYKTEKYGITGNILGWIDSFLSNRTQQVIINNSISSPAPVTSGIPQGSVLGPILFVLYINDLPEVVDKDSYVFLFADDTKLFRKICNDEDVKIIQQDINNLVAWSKKWLLKFHPDKCIYMGIGYNDDNQIEGKYNMDGHVLKTSDCEKDIGVHIDSKLKFESHINNSIKTANRVLAVARRTFECMDKDMFNNIFKGLVRPHLEYGAPIWSPHLVKHRELLENVQRRGTKIIPGLSNLSYKKRLRALKLPTLAYRRLRGDMIQVYKLTSGGYDESLPELLTMSETDLRGHDKKLFVDRPLKDIRKFSFTQRVTILWNKLPQNVINAKDVKKFEKALDNHWADQPLMYDDHTVNIMTKEKIKEYYEYE